VLGLAERRLHNGNRSVCSPPTTSPGVYPCRCRRGFHDRLRDGPRCRVHV